MPKGGYGVTAKGQGMNQPGSGGITNTPFADAIAKPKGGLKSPAPAQANKGSK